MKNRNNWLLVFVIAILAPAAHADITFVLNDGSGCSGCSPVPFGTITVSQFIDPTSGNPVDNEVLVTETLAKGIFFVKTGSNNHHALAFNIANDPAITISGLSTDFTVASLTGSQKQSGYPNFDYAIDCTGCGNGSSPPQVFGPLSFVVALTGAGTLSPSDFASGDWYFSSDINGSGPTGNVASNLISTPHDPTPTVPEPGSIVLFGTILAGIVTGLRKGTSRGQKLA
jgi:hypothetical protein